ncbi:hypothetical protein [Streptomyces sp. NPDC020917]|uniref:hypothetical protein n=1 Tax=Streptomyces sp. NPDC020917 TaxID=3365102 RepID=UPI0037B14CB0
MARVHVDGSLYLVAVSKAPKMRQDEKGNAEQVFNSATGEAMSVISLTEVFEGRAQVIKISVPESQVPETAVPGTVVRPVGLVCSPWGMAGMGNQINTGLSYRAERIDLAAASVPAPAPVTAGETRSKEAQK